MLETVNRQPGDNQGASVGAARAAVDAARDELDKLTRERQALPGQRAAAVERGDFEAASAYRDTIALVEDRYAFATQQLARAELAVLSAELAGVERDAQSAADQLTLAFANEERARLAYMESSSHRAGRQAHMQSIQFRAQELRQQHAAARHALQGKEE